MSKPYKTPVVIASPNIKVPEPKVSKFVIFIVKILGRIYLLFFWGIAKIVLHKDDKNLIDAFDRALAGKSRCIIAFRHPNGGEPQILTWFFLFKLRILAAGKGVRLVRRPHAVFVYSYEVVRYGGWVARFIMPNMGAMPVHHSKISRKDMDRIYNAITEGPYPVALAPEGQVSYTINGVPQLEPGVMRFGFTAADRLEKKGITIPVEILPVSIYFHFGSWGNMTMELLLRKIEQVCGLSGKDRKNLPFTERISRCRDHILKVNESRFGITGDNSLSFEERLDRVINAALDTAERMIGFTNNGDFFSRMYRLRQYYWDQIFLPSVDNFNEMTCLEKSVLDLRSGETWYIGRYQELADFCWYFRVPLPAEETDLNSKIEYVQNLWDFANRTMGGAFSDRVSIFPRKVIIRPSPVINLTERLESYRKDKKTAISEAMSDLEKAYQQCIFEISKENMCH